MCIVANITNQSHRLVNTAYLRLTGYLPSTIHMLPPGGGQAY